MPLREDLPVDTTPRHTADLPPTPVRDRFIPASAWVEAPPELLALGDDLGHETSTLGAGGTVGYIRRIGRWLLWRAGPATGGEARYMAVAEGDPARPTYRLHPDGSGAGPGADGVTHERFRAWKESLRDN